MTRTTLLVQRASLACPTWVGGSPSAPLGYNAGYMDSCDTLIDAIGNTPLIRLRKASEITGCTILGKA